MSGFKPAFSLYSFTFIKRLFSSSLLSAIRVVLSAYVRLFNLYAECIMLNAGLDEAELESRLLGEISITSDMQMTPLLWQKAKKNQTASW